MFEQRWLRDTHMYAKTKDQLDILCVRSLVFSFRLNKKGIYPSLFARQHSCVFCVFVFFFCFKFLLHLIQYSSTQSLKISLSMFRAPNHEHKTTAITTPAIIIIIICRHNTKFLTHKSAFGARFLSLAFFHISVENER